MAENETQDPIEELLKYQENLEGVLKGMSNPSFDWPAIDKSEARSWIIATLERVKAEIMLLVEPKERQQ